MNKLIVSVICLLWSFSASAGEVVFEGYPVLKIETDGQSAATYVITDSESRPYKVVIEKRGEDYFWSTRKNVQLVPVYSGVYITFVAVNGSGYVRVLNHFMHELYQMIPEEEKLKNYLYTEHLLHQMGSITYYGVAQYELQNKKNPDTLR